MDDFQSEYENLVAQTGPLMSYRLTPNKLIEPGRDYGIFLSRLFQVLNDTLGPDAFKSIRVLDLACLEGLYAIGFGLLGADVVAVEGRKNNLAKLDFTKKVLHLNNIKSVNDDVRNVKKETYGEFDVVLMCGILYHLNTPDPFKLIENAFQMAKKMVVIDTQVALSIRENYFYKGRIYWGRTVPEFSNGSPDEKMPFRRTSALDNEQSFWLSLVSLCNFLKETGFSSVYRCLVPYAEGDRAFYDRVTLIAYKGNEFQIPSQLRIERAPSQWNEEIGAKLIVHGNNTNVS